MSLIGQAGIGFAILALTVAATAMMIVVSAQFLASHSQTNTGPYSIARQVTVLTLVTVWLAVGLLLSMCCWGAVLDALGIFPTFEQSLYFSMVAFTTLGFGDVILPADWALLSGFIATNGFILFGLDTAFLFDALRRLLDE
ncbi:MAG: ion channel [Pseudomonadota bacterium]